ncbi:MAG: Flp family type IVb pilin [Planctomycetota bacterium]
MRKSFLESVKAFLAEEDGPTAVEYAVVVSLIAGGVTASVILLANATRDSFTDSATAIQ